MDLNLAFDIAGSIVAFLGGWLLNTLFDRIKSLEKQDNKLADVINDLRASIPALYARRDDLSQLGDNIFEALRRIEDKLDNKRDKNDGK